MDITQRKIDILNLPIRRKHIRLELLDENLKTIDTLEGVAINGSLTKNANDILRRSGNITIAIPIDRSEISFFDAIDYESINYNGKIWLDKNIKIFIGVEDNNNVVEWYNFGICLIDSPTRTLNANQYEITFNVIDLFARLTGNRKGQLTSLSTSIPQGNYTDNNVYVRTKTLDSLIGVIREIADIKNYLVYKIPTKYEYLPRDISVDIGGTIYDLLSQFLDILNTWQMYFDDNGNFVVEPIPSGVNDIVFPLNYEQYMSDEMSVNFSNVKNQIIVYGRLNTMTFYTENVEYFGTSLILRYETIDTNACVVNATLFGFKSINGYNNNGIQSITIYSGNTKIVENAKLVGFENAIDRIEKNEILPNEIYCLRIIKATLNSDDYINFNDKNNLIFEFYSKQQVSYCLVNDNRDSPFYINKGLSDKESYYCGLSYGLGDNYILHTDNITILNEIVDGTILTFMANQTNKDNCTVTVYNIDNFKILNNIPIVQDYWFLENSVYVRKPILANKISNDYTIWKIKYEQSNNCFVLLGKNEKALTLILNGGEYENIYADQLAYERCRYELYLHSNMNNSIKLGVIPNYLIDVNYKIEYDEELFTPINFSNQHNFIVKDNLNMNTEIFLTKDYTSDNYQNFSIKQDTKRYFLTKNITYPLGIDNTNQNVEAIEIYNDKNYIGSEYDL